MKLNRFVKNKDGFSNLIPLVLAVVITFAVLFIGGYVNGQISQSLADTYPTNATGIQADTLNTMNNTSSNWDASLNIVQVVIIITVLAAAIGAIFIFTKFR
jgi:hypothetical protein